MERHSKLVLNFALGRTGTPESGYTDIFIEGLRDGTSGKPALPNHHRWFPALRLGDRYYAELPLRLCTAHQSLWHESGGRAPVQPRRRRQFGEVPSHGRPRQEADLHVAYRTPEPHYQNADAAHDPPHKCVFKEAGQPVERLLPLVCVLQLLPHSRHHPRHLGDGSGITDHLRDLKELLA